jgi:hypothetical protein
MSRGSLWAIAGVAAVALAACGSAGAVRSSEEPPSRVVKVADSKVPHIVLTQRAVERLGLETAPVQEDAGSVSIPYSALIYSPTGRTWVYEQVGERTFGRAEVVVDRIEGDRALISSGPNAGVPVVTVAAAEVYGTEFFSDHE